MDAQTQAARLARRGDDPALLPDHQAFGEWMRGHARDPRHMPHVLTTDGWTEMRWDRLPEDGWAMEVIDTSDLAEEQVADRVLAWCRRALAHEAPVIRVGIQCWHSGHQ